MCTGRGGKGGKKESYLNLRKYAWREKGRKRIGRWISIFQPVHLQGRGREAAMQRGERRGLQQ